MAQRNTSAAQSTRPTAMDDWRQAVEHYYPNWETQTYFVPPVYFNRPNYTTGHVAGRPVHVQQPYGDTRPDSTSQPVPATQPAFNQSATSQPAASQPPTSEPTTSQPVTGQTGPSHQSAILQPVSQPTTSQSSVSQLTVSQPATKQPAASQPAARPPTTNHPVTSQPAASQPAAGQPDSGQPTSVGQVVYDQSPPPALLPVPGDPVHRIKTDGQEDASIRLVMGGLQALDEKEPQPMFVIVQLDYADILSKVRHLMKPKKQKKKKASSTANTQLLGFGDILKNLPNGDFDLLIVHLKHGIVIGEIKASGIDGPKDDKAVSARVEKVLKQLQKAQDVLAQLLSDIAPGVRIVKTIILPYITSQQLERVLKANTELLQAVCATLDVNPPDVTKAVGLCLLQDQLSHPATTHDVTDHTPTQLSGWFRRRVSAAVDPAMNRDVYLDILARLVGPASTVTVHCVTPPRVEVRTLGEAVSELGERLARVVLTPAQLSLLNRVDSLPRVCLVGPPGTGKTLMLVLVGLHWLSKGHDVLVLNTGSPSLAVARVIARQLEQTQREVPTPSAGTVRLCHLELWDKQPDMEAAIQSLAATATGHTLHILMDEPPFVHRGSMPALRHIVATLSRRVPGLRLWAATLAHTGIPPELHVETLTVPLRSAPAIVRQVRLAVDMIGGDIPSYTDSGVASPSDGPTVIRLRHEGGQHAGRWPIQCQQCGREVAHVLQHRLLVGVTAQGSSSPISTSGSTTTSPPPLQYRDVLVLTSSFALTDEERDASGRVVFPAADFVSGLRGAGIPVAVCSDISGVREPREAAQEDLALAQTDQVNIANFGYTQGLERKVVVYLPGRRLGADHKESDEIDEIVNRLQLVSRCSTQLVMVDVPAADVRELMHRAWLVRHFMAGTFCAVSRLFGLYNRKFR